MSKRTMIENACVLGASGAIGNAVVNALISRNIQTIILVRSKEKFVSLYPEEKLPGRISVIQGDLDSNQALATAFEHTDTIFPCFNTSYHHWKTDMTRWISRVADLAAALQARIIFPGNVFNFGKVLDNPINEEHPQNAHTEKGQLRIALEQRLARAAMEGATLTILRFPDLFGPAVLNSPITSVFRSALENKECKWYGNPHVLHEFIYSRDAGEAMVLAALEPRTADTVLHVAGMAKTFHDWVSMIYKKSHSNLSNYYNIVPNWKVKLTGILKKQDAELTEMLYLFENLLKLDGKKYEQIVGNIPFHEFEEAIAKSLDWYKFWFSTESIN